jgi:hypothetical protein
MTQEHEQGCTCDLCTGQRSWSSTEEYLMWSAGGSIINEYEYEEETTMNETKIGFTPDMLPNEQGYWKWDASYRDQITDLKFWVSSAHFWNNVTNRDARSINNFWQAIARVDYIRSCVNGSVFKKEVC